MLCASNHGKRVANVEFTDQVEVKLEAGKLEFGCGRGEFDTEGADAVGLAEAEAFNWAMVDVQERRKVRIIAIGQEQPVAGNQLHEPLERRLDRSQVFEDIRVIELKIVEDRHLGKVMDKLAAFIEESMYIRRLRSGTIRCQ